VAAHNNAKMTENQPYNPPMASSSCNAMMAPTHLGVFMQILGHIVKKTTFP